MSHFLYDRIGVDYAQRRRPDKRIGAQIDAALGQSQSVLNIGAGTGSYEPANRVVVALEPSAEMIRQRPQLAAPAVRGNADQLPFRDDSFDAALAILTVHHWPDREQGLKEMRRVARDRIVIFTWDPEHPGFWLVRDYLPEIMEIDRRAFPSLDQIGNAVGPIEVRTVCVPADCTDGFLGAYWRRPAEYLNPRVRAAISTFSRFNARAGLAQLRHDLDDATWLKNNCALPTLPELDVGYRLVIARCA